MTSKSLFLAVLALIVAGLPAAAQTGLDLSRYKERYATLSPAERAAYEAALAAELAAARSTWTVSGRVGVPAGVSRGPVQGDLCTAAGPGAVNPFNASSTTVGATNNYDIATTCGVAQTVFGGTGASLDVAFSVVTDANCTVAVSADPTGTNWDLALYVLQAPGAACTQLPSLADGQCITMDDDGASNTTEAASWSATQGTEYFVIIDGFNAATGTFDLTITGTGCNLVPVELQNFSIDR